jgi:hypothetical protein
MDRFRQGEQDVNYDNVQMDMSEVGNMLLVSALGGRD